MAKPEICSAEPTAANSGRPSPVTISAATGPAGEPLADAVENLLAQQDASGRWEGEVAWNTVLLSQYVLTCRMAGNWPLPGRDRHEILRHYQVTQRTDGSWPLHSEAPGSLFVTVLAYVALRVMGLPADDPRPAAARHWLRAQPDSVTVVTSWGRMWLAMLGLYEYEGINPLSPETVLLPRWVPVHPDRLYVHTRLIYFGLSCLYARRVRFDLGPLAGELRSELYGRPYESIDFAACRRALATADVAVRPARPLRLGASILMRYERHPVRVLRAAAVRRCLARLRDELEASAGQGVSPVSALLGCLVLADAGASHDAVLRALARLDAWRWDDQAEGLRIAGARSASWDTAFAMRALLCAPSSPRVLAALARGYRWLAGAQAAEELPQRLRQGRDRSSAAGLLRRHAPMAGFRLHGRGPVGGADRAPQARSAGRHRPAAARCTPLPGGRVHSVAAEPRPRVRYLRAHPRPRLPGKAQPHRDVCGLHDRSVPPRAHRIVRVGPGPVPAGPPRLPAAPGRRRDPPGHRVPALLPAARRQLPGQLGDQLHLCRLFRHRGPAHRRVRPQTRRSPVPPAGSAGTRSRTAAGGALHQLPDRPLRRTPGKPGRHDRVGAACVAAGPRPTPLPGGRSAAW